MMYKMSAGNILSLSYKNISFDIDGFHLTIIDVLFLFNPKRI